MELADLRERISEAEQELPDKVFVCIGIFRRDERPLTLAITERLRRKCNGSVAEK